MLVLQLEKKKEETLHPETLHIYENGVRSIVQSVGSATHLPLELARGLVEHVLAAIGREDTILESALPLSIRILG